MILCSQLHDIVRKLTFSCNKFDPNKETLNEKTQGHKSTFINDFLPTYTLELYLVLNKLLHSYSVKNNKKVTMNLNVLCYSNN